MPLPLAANTVDAAALADELARYRVVDAAALSRLLAEFPGGGPDRLAEFLVSRGALTAFQAERALAGEARRLALGPYRLTGAPARGTLGPLYAARHTARPGEFAVRVLPLRSLWRARQAKQLARTLAADVTHPAVSPLLEVDSANGYHYIVWARPDGPTLAALVSADGPLAPGAAAGLLGHLAAALAACHARGVAHGALTPHAVALRPGGLPQLLELGAGALLAQNVAEDESLFDSMSAAAAAAGVLTFAAPEVAADPNTLTAAADQYALGAVGYFAVTGLPPYPHPTLADELRAKRAGPPPSAAIVNPSVPAELAAVLERMMSPEPAARFASFAEVEARLAEVATAEPAAETPPELESLMLSKLRDAARGSGAVSWTSTGSGVLRPAERDGSDASVSFELPESALEGVGESAVATPGPLALGPGSGGQMSLSEMDTPVERRPANRTDAELPMAVADSVEEPAQALKAPKPTAALRPMDPRLAAPVPVKWVAPQPADEDGPPADAPPAPSVLWKKLRRKLLFWQAARDAVQVSVFGPPAVTPGQTVSLTVYLHPPDAADNVRTLSRAFQHDAELIGTGHLAREVARAAAVAVHLSVANAGVGTTQFEFEWRGQPHRLGFDLHVPWESPEGPSPGLVSVGVGDVRIGKVEFRFQVLARRA
jgi:serine/threonine protein kinase